MSAVDYLKKNKIMSKQQYKEWLELKLDEYGIDRSKLIGLVIVVERSVQFQLTRIGSQRRPPYYRLFKEDGSPTPTWFCAAEMALYLKYVGLKADPYVEAITHHPKVQKFMYNKRRHAQIPLGVLFPSARKNTKTLKSYTGHVRNWFIKR